MYSNGVKPLDLIVSPSVTYRCTYSYCSSGTSTCTDMLGVRDQESGKRWGLEERQDRSDSKEGTCFESDHLGGGGGEVSLSSLEIKMVASTVEKKWWTNDKLFRHNSGVLVDTLAKGGKLYWGLLIVPTGGWRSDKGPESENRVGNRWHLPAPLKGNKNCAKKVIFILTQQISKKEEIPPAKMA